MSTQRPVDSPAGEAARSPAPGGSQPERETLHAVLSHLAETSPETVALEQAARRVTYSSLNDLANAVAVELTRHELDRGSVVAVWSSDPGTQLMLSFGAWKAGMIVVILDTRDPEDRLRSILEQAGAEVVLAGEGEAAGAPDHGSGATVLEMWPGTGNENFNAAAVDASSPAVVVFTSGSEGRPKGVVRTHGNLLRQSRRETGEAGMGSTERVALLHPLNFSAGLKYALHALLGGSTLCFYDIQSRGLAHFGEWVRDEGITVLPSPVAFFRRFLRHAGEQGAAYPSCRCIFLGGERLYRRDVETVRRVFGDNSRLVYTYGSTECGGMVRNIIDPDTPIQDPVPVGLPWEGIRITILDRDGREAPVGHVGEIAVTAADLPPGYWNDPDATSRKYRPAPGGTGLRTYLTGDFGKIGGDGMLYLYNRNDRQLKIRGYRVEIEEIEIFLNGIQNVTHAVVTASEDETAEPKLTAYVTFSDSRDDRELLLKELKRQVARGLPAYMAPDDFIVLDVIPTTGRGKIDRRALDAMAEQDAASDAGDNVTDTERRVIEIWESTLGLEGLTVNDDILDLGVKSLSGMELCLVLGKAFSVEVPFVRLTLSPTVRELAAFIDSQTARKAGE